MAKEEKITEARRIVRQEKFQHLAKEKQNRVIRHEILQIKESLRNTRLLQRMELESVDEFSAQHRKRRQIIENSFKSKVNFAGYPRIYRSANDFFISVSVEKKNRDRKTRMGAHRADYKEYIDEGPGPFLDCNRAKEVNKCIEPPQNCNKANVVPSQGFKEVTEEERKESARQRTSREEINTKMMPENCDEYGNKLQLSRSHFESRILKNVFYMWKQYVENAKSKKEEEKLWKEKIDLFMKRLNNYSKKQKEEILKGTKAVRSLRTKTAPVLTNHKAIKNCFSTPCEESEEKELELISQAVAKSFSETREKLRSKSVLSLDPTLRGRAKLIRVYNAVVTKEDILENEHIMEFPEPRILLEMDQKQKERKKRLEELKEKRKVIEEEKDRLAKEKLQRQLREEEEEKRRKFREFQEKVRKERVEQEKRKQEWLRLKSLLSKAANFYLTKLLTKYGFEPWFKIIKLRRQQTSLAAIQDERRLKRLLMETWKTGMVVLKEEKERKALIFWRNKIIKKCLSAWFEVLSERITQMQVAEDWYDFLIARTTLKKWQSYVFIQNFELEDKWEIAIRHHKRKEATKYLKQWMLLPQVMYLEREKEERKQEWRRKIMQVIPDFTLTPSVDL